MNARTPGPQAYAAAVVALFIVNGLVGCAQEQVAPSAVETPAMIQCGSSALYEPSPDAGKPTVEEALEDHIGWLAETGVKDPPPSAEGEGTFSLVPELHTMEVALTAFEAGRHVERATFGEREVVTIQAIDDSGQDKGEVVVEQLQNGFYVTQVTARTGTAETLEECP